MDNQKATYLNILSDTLTRKLEVLKRLEEESLKQEAILGQQTFDADAFDLCISEKEKLIERLNGLDDGFLDLYERVKAVMSEDTNDFALIIKEIQELIKQITSRSTSLQALEERNRLKLERQLSSGMKKVKDFKVSSRTAAAYYKNMTGQHQEGDSYFFNKKE